MPLPFIVMIVIVAAAMTAFTIFQPDAELDPASSLLVVAVIVFCLALTLSQKTVTVVDERGVSVRRRFALNNRWPYGEIMRAEPKSYKTAQEECGGLTLIVSSMHMLHNDGVLLYLDHDKFTFISSKRAANLADAINTGRAAFEQRKYE